MDLQHITQETKGESKTLHDRAVLEITNWLKRTRNIDIVRVKQRLDYYGDFSYKLHPNQSGVFILVKAESSNIHGNLFLETWRDRRNNIRGWMYNECIAQWLAYYFIEDKELWMISLPHLQEWAIEKGNLRCFPERTQVKRLQENETCGRIVPISTLMRHLGKNRMHKYNVGD
jgi:hypothetical protein